MLRVMSTHLMAIDREKMCRDRETGRFGRLHGDTLLYTET